MLLQQPRNTLNKEGGEVWPFIVTQNRFVLEPLLQLAVPGTP
jgi:hypothetical protein